MNLRSSAAALALLVSASTCMAAGHCTATELNVFTCVAGSKVLSWCATGSADGKLNYLQYRLGKGKPEITLPASGKIGSAELHGELSSGSHGGGEALSVSAGEYTYEVVTTWDRGIDTAEVRVFKAQKQRTFFTCKPKTPIGLPTDGIPPVVQELHLTPRSTQ